ncbi:organic hydroperoxide resistance protein [Arthrobacter sedimenti]|uniref:organic hydroperoxide resistance protein n=1 Tax=Arthrobacter sedimenti TaxID=2694931 RepID=UPI000B3638D1|nr:organic hydroperoxide resistance protein [Arthrobacter sedimenti]OUM42008.1 organic hydroperoxide resistance protein [Arthrobacter agilis]
MSALYTAVATASGDGRNGKARTEDGELVVDLAVPKEMGGTGGATNPEQLFAAGYAACFHGALKLVASRGKAKISDTAVTAEVSIHPVDGGAFQLAVALHAEIGGVDQETADRLVEQAHQVCPYSNATRGNIEVTVDATIG